MSRAQLTIVLSTAYLISLFVPAYAYLDPGTGSMLLQGLIAGVATATPVVALYYQRLKLALHGLFNRKRKGSAE